MKKTVVITAIFILILLGAFFYYKHYTKSFSPETEVVYNKDGINIRVVYSRPKIKGRPIFGDLVPYNKVWRTGANEATIFETNTDLNFKGAILKAGTYSLWTVPGENVWKIIFNSESGQWGINFNQAPNKDAKNDVLSIDAPVVKSDNVVDPFTIDVKKVGEEIEMTFQWDKTLVPVTFSK